MESLEVMATVDESGQLTLDRPLVEYKNCRLKLAIVTATSREGEIEMEAEYLSKDQLLADFRQSWHEAMTGQTISISKLWEGIEDV
jgi:hypothetical protein